MPPSLDRDFYERKLYPLQDSVLARVAQAETKFYLTGGTAASRAYLNHRYSEDLNLFVNDEPAFRLWTQRIIQTLTEVDSFALSIDQADDRFVRLHINDEDIVLKVEMINDVPAHIGQVFDHPVLGRVDSAENILANKVTALIGRSEPKDLADVWAFCTQLDLSLLDAIEQAHSKAAGIFPPDLARVLCSASRADWELIMWTEPPPAETFARDLCTLGEQLIL